MRAVIRFVLSVTVAGPLLLGATNALALATERIGNKPVTGPEYEEWPYLLSVLNDTHRVYRVWCNGQETFSFQGDAEALNEALQRFALVRMPTHEVVLLPGPAFTQGLDGQSTFAADWSVSFGCGLLGILAHGKAAVFCNKDPVITVRIGGGNIDLAKVRIPRGFTVLEMAGLEKKYIQAMRGNDIVRSLGAEFLAHLDPSSAQSLNTITNLLADTNQEVRLDAIVVLKWFGARAGSAITLIRKVAEASTDRRLKEQAAETITAIKASKAHPAQVKWRNTVLEEISRFRKSLTNAPPAGVTQ
jgi:hypothetical protein